MRSVAGVLAPSVFSTDGLAGAERRDAWHGQFCSLNDVLVDDTDALPACRNENWPLGGMLLSVNSVSPCRFERSQRQVRGMGVDHWIIRRLRRGTNRKRIGDQAVVLRPGELLAFSLDDAWTSEWSDAAWISLCLPRDLMPRVSASLSAIGSGRVTSPGAQLLADFLPLLERNLRDAPADRLPALIEATRAMVSACLLRDLAPDQVSPADLRLSQFERVRSLVRRHIASPTLTPARLARLAGMSRTALYRLLEPQGGAATYIQTVRVNLAQALLSDPALAGVPIAQLVERIGFYDASAFSRAFRAAHGCTPREARAAALSGIMPSARNTSEQPAAADYGTMLRRIGTPVSGGEARDRTP